MSSATLIHEVHDMWPATLIELGGMSRKNPFVAAMQISENSAYSKSDKVVSIPPYTETYMKHHGLREGRFVHIPNGAAKEEWEDAKELPDTVKNRLEILKESGKFIVGYFGGHAMSNALDVLLDGAKTFLDNRRIVFVLVGKGVEKKRLEERCKNETIQNVIFLDAVEKKCIPNLVAYFDCVYMGTLESPLYRFGLGLNKFYDAMMAGKPIVLSATVPETIIEKYNCGIVVPSGDLTKIHNAIERIYRMQPEERRKLGNNGKTAVENNFMYHKLAGDFENIVGNHTKNILLINHYAGSPELGMEFRPYYFAREWVKVGYRVDIIAADYSHLRIKNPKISRDFEEEIIDGIHYHWIHTGTYEGNGIKRALTMFQFVGKIWLHAKWISRELKPGVIITSSTYPLDTYAGQRIKKYSGGY